MEAANAELIAHDGFYPSGELVDQIVALMRRTKTIAQKDEMVRKYTRTGADRVSLMTERDAGALLASLTELEQRMDKMRKKIISIAHQIGWKAADGSGKADYKRIDDWLRKFRGKVMNAMDWQELSDAITQMERMFANIIEGRRI